MPSYTFESLSPAEFEILSRDLLQKELNLTLESFMSGRDKGIDLRYSRDPQGTTIIQCKRYLTSYAQLKRDLQKEAPKVAKLNPARYILITSVPLNVHRKEAIQKLFAPYIVSPGDIYGRDDINNLLAKYPDIEQQHYKLWFSSVNILQSVLHADIVNKTRFEEEDIRATVSTFAENDGYPLALNVFRRKGFVIISGAPGVGKTTLARMIIFRMIASKKYDQFVFVSRDINEAFTLLDDSTSQLFFFDDFLGRNYFERSLDRNEDSDLVRFIDRIIKSKNKALILTTREYILQQAQAQYADLRLSELKHNKYVVDLGSYTKKIKASILYNHLHAAGLPPEYLAQLLDARSYKTLINHRNYNPRLIESILKERPWERVAPADFSKTLVSYFDDPLKIWQDVFETGISADARLLLRILFTLSPPISYDSLYRLFQQNLAAQHRQCDHHTYDRALKELDGTFIKTYRSADKSTILVEYQNPGIFDFLLAYYKGKRRGELVPVIEQALLLDQLTERFTDAPESTAPGRIHLTDELRSAIATKVLAGLQNLPWAQDTLPRTPHTYRYHLSLTYSQMIITLLISYNLSANPEVRAYLLQYFIDQNEEEAEAETFSQLDLLQHFAHELNEGQKLVAIERAADAISVYEDIDYFLSLGDDYNLAEAFHVWMSQNSLSEITTRLVEEDIDNLDANSAVDFRETLDDLGSRYEFDYGYIEDFYERALRDMQAEPDYDDVFLRSDIVPRMNGTTFASPATHTVPDEETEIENMFESLRS